MPHDSTSARRPLHMAGMFLAAALCWPAEGAGAAGPGDFRLRITPHGDVRWIAKCSLEGEGGVDVIDLASAEAFDSTFHGTAMRCVIEVNGRGGGIDAELDGGGNRQRFSTSAPGHLALSSR